MTNVQRQNLDGSGSPDAGRQFEDGSVTTRMDSTRENSKLALLVAAGLVSALAVGTYQGHSKPSNVPQQPLLAWSGNQGSEWHLQGNLPQNGVGVEVSEDGKLIVAQSVGVDHTKGSHLDQFHVQGRSGKNAQRLHASFFDATGKKIDIPGMKDFQIGRSR